MHQPAHEIFEAYGLDISKFTTTAFGTGLINNTWRLKNSSEDFILQRINTNVFNKPVSIAENIHLIGNYLHKNHPHYFFTQPVSTLKGNPLFNLNNKVYYRLFPFVSGSHTIDKVSSAKQAYEAAKQFGKFTKMLSRFNVMKLNITVADFHNLSLRYRQFEAAVQHGNKERKKMCIKQIEFLINQKSIAAQFEYIRSSAHFKLRVTHHDTKISNILFNDNENGICVIDLDTVMPGYFISDVGDMLRTYVSPVSEEEKDFSCISIRTDFFEAILKGYLSEMKDELTEEEKNHLVYAGSFMIYMQALRFLTDYLNNDIYYGARYADHNFVRAGNQIELFKKYLSSATQLREIASLILLSV